MMSSWNNVFYPSMDHLSVEVHSDVYPLPVNSYETSYDPVLTPLFDLEALAADIVGICDPADLAGKRR